MGLINKYQEIRLRKTVDLIEAKSRIVVTRDWKGEGKGGRRGDS
jgi:hypothetical protein